MCIAINTILKKQNQQVTCNRFFSCLQNWFQVTCSRQLIFRMRNGLLDPMGSKWGRRVLQKVVQIWFCLHGFPHKHLHSKFMERSLMCVGQQLGWCYFNVKRLVFKVLALPLPMWLPIDTYPLKLGGIQNFPSWQSIAIVWSVLRGIKSFGPGDIDNQPLKSGTISVRFLRACDGM